MMLHDGDCLKAYMILIQNPIVNQIKSSSYFKRIVVYTIWVSAFLQDDFWLNHHYKRINEYTGFYIGDAALWFNF